MTLDPKKLEIPGFPKGVAGPCVSIRVYLLSLVRGYHKSSSGGALMLSCRWGDPPPHSHYFLMSPCPPLTHLSPAMAAVKPAGLRRGVIKRQPHRSQWQRNRWQTGAVWLDSWCQSSLSVLGPAGPAGWRTEAPWSAKLAWVEEAFQAKSFMPFLTYLPFRHLSRGWCSRNAG